MERKRFSVLFFIKKTRLLANGEAPIRLRITYDGQYAEVQVKRSVPVELWSQAREQAMGKDRRSMELNSYLELLRVKLYRIHQDMELKNLPINAKRIKDCFMGNDPETTRTLCSVFKEHNERCHELIGKDYAVLTVARYDNCLKYLREVIKKFHGKDDLPLKDVTGELVRNFEFYLKTEKNCQQNTMIRYMKCFKKIINLSIANEWITRSPFTGIKVHENVVNKEFLTQDEIYRIYNKNFNLPRLEVVGKSTFTSDPYVCIWAGRNNKKVLCSEEHRTN